VTLTARTLAFSIPAVVCQVQAGAQRTLSL